MTDAPDELTEWFEELCLVEYFGMVREGSVRHLDFSSPRTCVRDRGHDGGHGDGSTQS